MGNKISTEAPSLLPTGQNTIVQDESTRVSRQVQSSPVDVSIPKDSSLARSDQVLAQIARRGSFAICHHGYPTVQEQHSLEPPPNKSGETRVLRLGENSVWESTK